MKKLTKHENKTSVMMTCESRNYSNIAKYTFKPLTEIKKKYSRYKANK